MPDKLSDKCYVLLGTKYCTHFAPTFPKNKRWIKTPVLIKISTPAIVAAKLPHATAAKSLGERCGRGRRADVDNARTLWLGGDGRMLMVVFYLLFLMTKLSKDATITPQTRYRYSTVPE